MKTYRSLAFGLMGAAVLGLGAVTTGLAQPAPGPGGMPPGHGMRMDPAQMQAHRQEHEQRMAARLRAVLQLRADQEPALQALIASMRPPEGMAGHGPGMGGPGMGGMGGMGRPDTLPTPQRLDRMSQRMAEHQRRFQAHADAIRRFYAQLSPTQQAAFDALPPRMMGHGGPHGRGGPHGMRGGRGMGGMGMGGPGMGGPGMGGMGPGN